MQQENNSRRISVRVKDADEKIIAMLCQHLERDLSDTIRFSFRHTAREYGLIPSITPTSTAEQNDTALDTQLLNSRID